MIPLGDAAAKALSCSYGDRVVLLANANEDNARTKSRNSIVSRIEGTTKGGEGGWGEDVKLTRRYADVSKRERKRA